MRVSHSNKFSDSKFLHNFEIKSFFLLFCRPLLEEFEQSCATDNYTKTCAGYPEQCRIGMLGILGTKLRTNCICKGTDRAKLYECIGWQRVLWFNPCVG